MWDIRLFFFSRDTSCGRKEKNGHAGMAELADAQDLGSCGAIRVGSTPTTRTTSEQAMYRLLRLFLKSERAHAAAPPFQIATAYAGLRFGAAALRRICPVTGKYRF